MGSPIPNEENVKRGVKRCREFVKQWNEKTFESKEFNVLKEKVEESLKKIMENNPDLKEVKFKVEGDGPIEIETVSKDGTITKKHYKLAVEVEDDSFRLETSSEDGIKIKHKIYKKIMEIK